jgi:hypothetical protein
MPSARDAGVTVPMIRTARQPQRCNAPEPCPCQRLRVARAPRRSSWIGCSGRVFPVIRPDSAKDGPDLINGDCLGYGLRRRRNGQL